MTRLQKHYQKENTKKIIFLLAGIVILMIIFFQIGLKALINATVFMNDTFSNGKATTEPKKEDSFFGTLYVNDPPAATNSAEIIVSGESSNFDVLEFYINNTKVEDTNIRKDSFEQKIGKLREGENKVVIMAKTDDSKHKKESEAYTVFYKNEPPTLEISSPHDNDTVNKQDLSIQGKTDPEVSIKVNKQPVVVDFTGKFTKTYRLKEGENKLEFIAEDAAGNTEKKIITVKYQKDE